MNPIVPVKNQTITQHYNNVMCKGGIRPRISEILNQYLYMPLKNLSKPTSTQNKGMSVKSVTLTFTFKCCINASTKELVGALHEDEVTIFYEGAIHFKSRVHDCSAWSPWTHQNLTF